MALRKLTPEEVAYLSSKGIDVTQLPDKMDLDDTSSEMSTGQAIKSTLKSHAGGIVGGGAGALVTGAAVTALNPLIGIPLVAAAAMGSGYLGQKAQEKIQGEDVTRQLAEEQAQAEQQHPYATLGTDIVASALASGGAPKPSNIPRAIRSLISKEGLNAADAVALNTVGREAVSPTGNALLERVAGDKKALQAVMMNAAINPAVNTGLEFATTGQLPSGKDVLAQTLGGALFSGQNPLAKIGHREPTAEPKYKEGEINVQNLPNELTPEISPFNQRDANGQYVLDRTSINQSFKDLNPRPDTSKMSPEDTYIAESKWRQRMKLSDEEKRNQLHANYLEKLKASPPVKTPEQIQTEQEMLGLKAKTEQVKAAIPQAIEDKSIVPPVKLTTPDLSGEQELIKKNIEDQQKRLEAQKLEEEIQKTETAQALEKTKALASQPIDTGSVVPKTIRLTTPDFTKETGQVADKINEQQKIIDQQKAATEEALKVTPEKVAAHQEFQDTMGKIGQKLYRPNFANRDNVTGTMPLDTFVKRMAEVKQTSSQGTVKEYLNTISKDPSSQYQSLAHKLKMDPDSSNVPIVMDTKFSTELTKNNVGSSFYDPNTDSLFIHDNHIGSDETIIHEILHAATTKKIPREWSWTTGLEHKTQLDNYLKTGKNESLKELINCYFQAAKGLNLEDFLFKKGGLANDPIKVYSEGRDYGMSNLNEFISETMSNPEFQKKLNNIPSGKNETVWTRFVSAIKSILGLDVKQGSLLERALKPIDELTQQKRVKDFSKNDYDHASVHSPDYARPKDTLDTDPSIGGKPAGLFRSTLDRIRGINHPIALELADKAQNMLDERGQLMGKWWYPTAKYRDEINKAGEARLVAAQRYELENQKDAPASMFKTDAERNAWANYKKALEDNYNYRVANKEPVLRNGTPSMPIRDKYYHPTSLSNDIAEQYKNGQNVAANDKTYIDYLTNKIGLSLTEAQDKLDTLKKSIQGQLTSSASSNLQHFNASRVQQGIPLPPEFTKKGFFKNLESYWNRTTLDNSFYKNIESNHELLGALGETKDAWHNPVTPSPDGSLARNNVVSSFLDSIRGEHLKGSDYTEKASSSLATAAMLGPGTEVHKVISNEIGVTAYLDNPYQASRYLGASIKNYKEGLQHAYENGIIRIPSAKITDALDGQLTGAERMRGLAQGVRSIYTLNDLTTKLSIGSMQAGLESVFPMKIAKANAGDFNNQKLLRQLDPDYVVGKTYAGNELSQLVSKAINQIQGTGDARTMPPWMLSDSEISGFMRLSHWSISQTNRFFKQVWEPATRGSYEPLIKATFGSLVGGYMIKQLREELQGKKGQIPSLSEIASSERGLSGNAGLLAYNAMAAATYAGLGGMLAMVAKAPFDMIYKNKPQGMVFPLDEFGSDIASTISDATTAIANDPSLNWGSLSAAVATHLLSHTFQLGRVVWNQAVNNGIATGTLAEKKLLNDKLGQLRRFNMVEGIPYSQQDMGGNPFMNLEQKSFKMEQDPSKAIEQVMPLIHNLINAYSDKPDVMMSKIRALKQNQYATMPSMEDTPLSFLKYLSFLGKKESPTSASEALLDYMKHKMINQAKSSVIP